MNLDFLLKFVTFLQLFVLSQHSHVQDAKQRIRAEVRGALGHPHHHHYPHYPIYRQLPASHVQKHYHGSHWRDGQHVHRLYKWSGRRKPIDHHQFSGWTAWSKCDGDCIKHRERYCKAKRKCGHTKHLEQRKCKNCHPAPVLHEVTVTHAPWPALPSHNMPQTIIINAAAASGQHVSPTSHPPPLYGHHVHVPVLEEIDEPNHRGHRPKHHRDYAPVIVQNTLPPSLSAESQQEEETEGEVDDALSITETSTEDESTYGLRAPHRFRKKPTPILVDEDDYDELIAEEQNDELDEFEDYEDDYRPRGEISPIRVPRTRNFRQRRQRKQQRKSQRHRQKALSRRNLAPGDDGIEGDIFQYEDFDFPSDAGHAQEDQYGDSYEDDDYVEYRNSSFNSLAREKANGLTPKHRRIYSKWSRWTKCSPKCTTRRYKKCRVKEQCGREVLREIAYCYTEGSFCQQWLQAQVQKSPPYELRPVAASRRRDISDGTQSNNAIASDFIMNSKGYRGPEYAPLKLKCGIAPIRSNKRSMYNMLKIIGGKAARRGEWPWQVAIFNRFKEAFCGGTLIAPQWVLTAAHCVRKVLHVRIGEHNLDYEDGTEIQLRVLKSFKHPNFDKKTVDSDVALLKLPKPVNSTTWIGFSCLPRPYQPLPKNIECTVIGWGKRRNRDAAGTSVLHQASVPIIPMDNCRSVYQDYTITKNMFCAGHKRGRIDTCAGDSGGPLLCRDATKPNHPWTIFGITSFGDGCAKRNKFGIYAKVPNYVDWVWSVINCNGNCKLHQRNYSN